MAKLNLQAMASLREKIQRNTSAIEGLAEILIEIRAERVTEDCREWCKNDFLAESIETAIAQLARYSNDHVGEIGEALMPCADSSEASPPAKGRALTH